MIAARDALTRKTWNFVVRMLQECSELGLKSALRVVGIDYPKRHDISFVLNKERGLFPPWFDKRIDEFASIASVLARRRSISMYGFEGAPEDESLIITEKRAIDYSTRVEKLYTACENLLKETAEREN